MEYMDYVYHGEYNAMSSIRFTSACCPLSSKTLGIRSGLLLMLIVSFVCLGAPRRLVGGDEKLPKAEVILDKYVQATGGKDAYEKLSNRLLKGTMELTGTGIKAAILAYEARPCKLYTLIESAELGRIEEGTNGDIAWELTTMTGPRIKQEKEKAAALRLGTFNRNVDWKRLYEKVETVAVESIDDKPCFKILVTPLGGSPETRYYDTVSKLLTKIERTVHTPMGPMPMELHRSDYKKVDGILIAHTERQKLGGQDVVISTESVRHNVRIPTDRFELPADIQELLDKEKNDQRADD